MPMQLRALSASLAVVALTATPPAARAEPLAATPGQESAQLAALETGDQLVLDGYTGSLAFAGQQIELTDFSGVLGYASEAAYALTIEGSARIGDQSAARGRMLMVAPFNQGIVSERFDARRLHSSMIKAPQSEKLAPVLASLQNLARGQDRGVFLGRLTRTNFNVTTMGSVEQEEDRRARIGGAAIRQARFSAPESVSGSEERIVQLFVQALQSGDAAAVAQFIDPLPFGSAALGKGGGEVRQVAARNVLAQADWSQLKSIEPEQIGDTSWLVSGSGIEARIDLRRTTDFAFIQSVQVGE